MQKKINPITGKPRIWEMDCHPGASEFFDNFFDAHVRDALEHWLSDPEIYLSDNGEELMICLGPSHLDEYGRVNISFEEVLLECIDDLASPERLALLDKLADNIKAKVAEARRQRDF